MTDVMQSYNYNTLYAYQQQARLQGFGGTSANQGGYVGETSAPTEANPSLANGSHELPQIRGHVNVSMAHLQQEQQMPKLESELTQQVPTQQPPQQPNQLDQSMNYHQQQPPQQQQQQQGPSQTSGEMKKYYENDEDEESIIDEHFNKSFATEQSRTRLRHPSTFPASFYTQSASPQRSSSTSGYNGSLPGSVSPSSNPYAPGFPNQAVSQLYAAQQAAQGFHPTTSPLATTNNGTTTAAVAAVSEWPYSSQYQQAFSHPQYQATNTQAGVSSTPSSTLQSHHAYNQLAYPFTQHQEQHHRTPAFATGFPQY